MVCFIENKEQKEQISSRILNELPEWFGLPEINRRFL